MLPQKIKTITITICWILALNIVPTANAQMKPGDQMRDWFEVFKLDEKKRDFDYQATIFASNQNSNVFYSGEKPELQLQVRNNTNAPLRYDGKVEIIHWGTRITPGDIWRPQVIGYGKTEEIPLHIDLPARGYHNYTLKPVLPEQLGGYALIIDLGSHGRRFLTSIVRALKNDSTPEQFPLQASEFFPPEAMQRLGLQAIRYGIGFNVKSSPERQKNLAALDEVFNDLKKHNVAVTIQIGTGLDGQILGTGRPHLDEKNVMMETKKDLVWDPKHDDDFRHFCYDLAVKYGWPKGPVNGFMLWNEPWEGISISGWGADMIRYRDLYRIMSEAVTQARKDTGLQILIGGCDSSSNTFDKLFPDGKNDFMPYLDFCSIHYQGLASPCLYRKWLDRKPGRVLVWDTESWVANSEDLLSGVVAANRAAGYDRSMGFYGGYVFGNRDSHTNRTYTAKIMTDSGEKTVTLPLVAYPMAAGIAAMQKFIGSREFKEIFFKQGLPWVFVFNGLNNSTEDGTMVITGDLKGLFGDVAMYPNIRPLAEIKEKARITSLLPTLKPGTPEWAKIKQWLNERQVGRTVNDNELIPALRRYLDETWPFAGVSLKISAESGKFALFDMYGNAVAPINGQYLIPLDVRGFYLRSTAAGGIEAMRQAVQKSEMSGISVAELIPHDFLEPVKPGAKMRLTLHNITNRTLNGGLKGTLGKLTINYPEKVTLTPFESRDITVEVTGGTAVPENQYPLRFEFKAGQAGMAIVEDVMRSNIIAHRSIKVDGKLDDWQNVAPQIVTADREEQRSVMEAAWLPFQKFEAGKTGGMTAFYTAWDDKYFYVAAKIADTTPHPGTLRFATKNDDMFFYPEISYKYDLDKTYATAIEQETEESIALCGMEKPGQPGSRSGECIRPIAVRMRLDLELPTDRLTKVTFYLPWKDFRSNRVASIYISSMTGRSLVKTELKELKGGGFVTCELAGKVAVEIANWRTWHKESGRLAGVFFDAAATVPDKKVLDEIRKNGGWARYVGLNENEPGKWIGRFGEIGYFLPGLKAEKIPAGIICRLRDDAVKQELAWPQDVRRFSYRTRPILPDGLASKFDNVQIAFNAIPLDEDPVMISHLPGRMPGFVDYRSSDYEFALNKVAAEYGGGYEIWRLEVPNSVRKHFYPRQPKADWEGAATGGLMAVEHQGGTRIMEAAIPWSEIPHVQQLLKNGKPVKFSFRINDDGGSPIEFGQGRAASRRGGQSFHPDWKPGYANEIEFAFEK